MDEVEVVFIAGSTRQQAKTKMLSDQFLISKLHAFACPRMTRMQGRCSLTISLPAHLLVGRVMADKGLAGDAVDELAVDEELGGLSDGHGWFLRAHT